MNVLVHHRNIETVSSIRRALESGGHRVRPVASSAELVESASAGDLVILDADERAAIDSLTTRLPGTGLLVVDSVIDPDELLRLVQEADARARRDPQSLI